MIAAGAAAVVVLLMVGLLVGMAIGRANAPVPTNGVIEPPDAVPLPVVGPTATPQPANAPGGAEPVPVDDQGAGATPALQDETDPVTLFTSTPGLDDTVTTAAGYGFQDAGIDRRAFAALLARKFGVDGTPRRTAAGSWVVAGQASELPRVEVMPGPMVTWQFIAASTAVPSGAVVSPGPSPSGTPSAVDEADRATALARAFLADLGVPVDDVDWQVEVTSDGTVVTGWQVIAGQRTTVGWRMTLGSQGQMTQASGFAASPVQIDGYEVIGARSAVDRSQQPQWAALGPTPLTPAATAEVAPTGPAGSFDGRPVAGLAVRTVVVTSADLGLAQFTQPDGGLLILPAYVLTGEDGSTWSLVAVSDAYVRAVRPLPASSAATTR